MRSEYDANNALAQSTARRTDSSRVQESKGMPYLVKLAIAFAVATCVIIAAKHFWN